MKLAGCCFRRIVARGQQLSVRLVLLAIIAVINQGSASGLFDGHGTSGLTGIAGQTGVAGQTGIGDEYPMRLPRTSPWNFEMPAEDVMIEGLHRCCRRTIEDLREQRYIEWLKASPNSFLRTEEQVVRRDRFRKLIGVVDERLTAGSLGDRTGIEAASVPAFESDQYFEIVTHRIDSPVLARSRNIVAYQVRWPVMNGITAEGLMFVPESIRAAVVAIPDADLNPEEFGGLAHSHVDSRLMPAVQTLAESGCLVIVPLLISRSDEHSGRADIRMTNQPHREFITRQAFEVGRHVIGYEVQKILAAVDLLEREFLCHPNETVAQNKPIGVLGVGEGGLLALYTAALDPRIQSCCVSGYFESREEVWQEPIYRNVWKLLTEFGDAELAALICPRRLVIEACRVSEVTGPPEVRAGRFAAAAPGIISECRSESVRIEYERGVEYYSMAGCREQIVLAESEDEPGSDAAINAFLDGLQIERAVLKTVMRSSRQIPVAWRDLERQQFDQMQDHVQKLIIDSEQFRLAIREDLISDRQRGARQERLRNRVHDELIGRIRMKRLPFNPRSRRLLTTDHYVGYEIALDVYEDVIATGILLLPKMKPGEKRPVIVCQHGLEGRPMDTISRDAEPFRTYKAFAEELVLQGFIVYCPQNPYIGGDRFRVLQRMAHPTGRTLFSYIIAQHQQTLDWLVSNPQVDSRRIAFYGISYGGKTAMRVPPFVGHYSAVICSGDFTDWARTIASNADGCSYLFTGEYEIPEWNLAHLAGYAELAMLIAPRPFMVEAGRKDSGQPLDWVDREFRKVRAYYDSQKIGDRAEIEFFDGPHTINGIGTFDFLQRHLK